MTVGTTTNVAKLLTDGLATEFPYPFIVFSANHLEVFLRDLDGVVVKEYAQNELGVSGLGQNSGSVTIIPAPPADHELVILRRVPVTQDTDIVNQGGFFPEVIEKQLDLIVMQVQQLREQLNRAITSDIGDPTYSLGRLEENDIIQFRNNKLNGISIAEASQPAIDAANAAQGFVAALVTYTFGYIGIEDSTPPEGVAEGDGYVYVLDGRVFGAINDGGSPDVKFELLTRALADTGGPGNGTVVSVNGSGGNTGLTLSGGPITASGTLTLGGILAIEHGGTGAVNPSAARSNLGAAASDANEDITSLRQSVTITSVGTPTANSLGFRGLPLSAQAGGSAITLSLNDSGRMVQNTTGGWIIPANAAVPFPIGTTCVLYNNSGNSQSVTITSDTLRQAGTANTGTRTISQRGFATLVKVAATEWVISGNIS
jgi:hypothetical protein